MALKLSGHKQAKNSIKCRIKRFFCFVLAVCFSFVLQKNKKDQINIVSVREFLLRLLRQNTNLKIKETILNKNSTYYIEYFLLDTLGLT